jgi:hypothetical protein
MTGAHSKRVGHANCKQQGDNTPAASGVHSECTLTSAAPNSVTAACAMSLMYPEAQHRARQAHQTHASPPHKCAQEDANAVRVDTVETPGHPRLGAPGPGGNGRGLVYHGQRASLTCVRGQVHRGSCVHAEPTEVGWGAQRDGHVALHTPTNATAHTDRCAFMPSRRHCSKCAARRGQKVTTAPHPPLATLTTPAAPTRDHKGLHARCNHVAQGGEKGFGVHPTGGSLGVVHKQVPC